MRRYTQASPRHARAHARVGRPVSLGSRRRRRQTGGGGAPRDAGGAAATATAEGGGTSAHGREERRGGETRAAQTLKTEAVHAEPATSIGATGPLPSASRPADPRAQGRGARRGAPAQDPGLCAGEHPVRVGGRWECDGDGPLPLWRGVDAGSGSPDPVFGETDMNFARTERGGPHRSESRVHRGLEFLRDEKTPHLSPQSVLHQFTFVRTLNPLYSKGPRDQGRGLCPW